MVSHTLIGARAIPVAAGAWRRRELLHAAAGLTTALCCGSSSKQGAMATNNLKPPQAPRVNYIVELFGDVRQDHFFWLRDDKRQDPNVLAYLKEENAYAQQVMEDTQKFQEEMYNEMRKRIKEEDSSVPRRDGDYFYYTRELEGKQYQVHCRRLIPGGAGPGTVDEVMATEDGSPPEEILLDENEEATGHEFYVVGDVEVSPDHTRLAYSVDTVGDELYDICVVDIASKRKLGCTLKGATEDVRWVDNETLVYLTQDETLRPYKAWCHNLMNEQSDDHCLYHEEDETFSLGLHSSESKEYTFVGSASKITSFVLYMKNNDPEKKLKYLTQRVEGTDTSATHRGDHFFITKRTNEIFNSELLVCPVDDVSATTVVVPHRPSVKLEEVAAAKDHLILFERENALQSITIYKLPPLGQPITALRDGKRLKFPETAYGLSPKEFQYNSTILRYTYSSLTTPPSVFDYDMETGTSVMKKREEVLGGFDVNNYASLREWVTAEDGTRIPISIVYRKDRVRLDGSDPLLLYGYGSYEVCIDPEFSKNRLSIIDRGVVFAIAHIRGGGELGRKWYEDGKLHKKKNTFTDFITAGEYLIEKKYCARDKLCIQGRSAGGLLIGAVVTMRPDLFRCALAEVPFVDVVTTMLDASIPLTTSEWEEWGDPHKEEDYHYIKSYSPVDNVAAREYPDILVTGGLHDPRVGYWEPAKFVAKLRQMKTNNSMLLFKCEFGAGHHSMSGRFDKLKDVAFSYTFVLKSLGMAPTQ